MRNPLFHFTQALLVLSTAVVFAQAAHATVGTCGANDAPVGSNNQPCRSVCTESGSELVCELETFCANGPAQATAVTTFGSSTHDVSIWGRCFDPLNPIDFCCVFDDDANTITRVELNGTPGADEALTFSYQLYLPDEENLQPWDDDDVTGVIRGNRGADHIYGSNFAQMGYEDILFGQDGNDRMYGLKGRDKLSGGDGADYIEGGANDDTLWGGDGNDELYGMLGNDALCDASGYNYCASDGGNFMDGGGNDDKLWYDESENPNVPCPGILLDSSSTAGTQAVRDECGDYSNFDPATELPGNCEAYITTKPSQCEGAF
jgi:hypothetical protein